ncbi:hypothetical protein C8R45DRAFT_946605 [Mycena sanguinolenta]|nr:hypothetical protein C8R45DRAFT_946605 [Mycena sanguinolenta]
MSVAVVRSAPVTRRVACLPLHLPTGFHALEARQFGTPGDRAPSLVMCPGNNCDLADGCSYVYILQAYLTCCLDCCWSLPTANLDTCLTGFNFGVYIAEPACENGLQLPTVNNCYNRVIRVKCRWGS